jgi:hypothetical protein
MGKPVGYNVMDITMRKLKIARSRDGRISATELTLRLGDGE